MKRTDPAPVAMPTKTTFKKGRNGTIYVYLTLRAYRNAAGKPTSDEAAIGKLAADGVSLIPNQRYYEFFDTGVRTRPESCVNFGDTATLWLLADRLGVRQCIRDAAGELASYVLLSACYMTLEGNIMSGIQDFCEHSWTPDRIHLDSPRTSELFASLDFAVRTTFFRNWIARRVEDEYIAYDVTSLSTYAGGIEDAEWGHNRDADNLCQINLGMFFGETTYLPVYFETYQGSVLDKTHLPHIMASAQALGISKTRFVFDRGFVTKNNLALTADQHLSFVTALPISRKDAQSLLTHTAPLIRRSSNRVDGEDLYATTSHARVENQHLKCFVYYSPYKAAGEEQIIYAKVSQLETELAKLVSAKTIPRRYTEFFTVTTGISTPMSFSRDHTKIDTHLAKAGYFILITNDETLTPTTALNTYRGKDVIEKAFAGMKNHLDFRRMRTHHSHTTDGKLFTGFIALILRSAIRQALSTHAPTHKTPVDTALRELRKLKRITYQDGTIIHTTITKTQRQILTALNLDKTALLTTK